MGLMSLFEGKGQTKLIAALSLLMSCGLVSAQSPEYIPVWEYYESPPFVIDADNEEGITYDFARILSEQSKGRYRFEVEQMSLARLMHKLQADELGIVLWANHLWFHDPDKSKYLWSDTLVHDESSVISPISLSLEYKGAESLKGKDFLGISGYYYSDVDTLVEQGKIDRRDAKTEEAALQMVASERADVTIFSMRAAHYYRNKFKLADKLYFSSEPYASYERYALIQANQHALHDYINTVITRLPGIPAWQDITTISNYD